MYTPVGSIARLIPFHEAIILYFCLAVRGSLGSGGAGAGGSGGPSSLPPPPLVNFPNSQPMLSAEISHNTTQHY